MLPTMTRSFKARTLAEAHAKADAWLEAQSSIRNVSKHAYEFRAAFPIDALEDEDTWTVAVRYEEDS